MRWLKVMMRKHPSKDWSGAHQSHIHRQSNTTDSLDVQPNSFTGNSTWKWKSTHPEHSSCHLNWVVRLKRKWKSHTHTNTDSCCYTFFQFLPVPFSCKSSCPHPTHLHHMLSIGELELFHWSHPSSGKPNNYDFQLPQWRIYLCMKGELMNEWKRRRKIVITSEASDVLRRGPRRTNWPFMWQSGGGQSVSAQKLTLCT